MGKDLPQDDPVIAEFQERRREFRHLWKRTLLSLAAPGGALVALGGYFEAMWMVWVGLPLFAIAMARGVMLWCEYLRCPQCNAVQVQRGFQLPYLTCRSCGARLSVGLRDQA